MRNTTHKHVCVRAEHTDSELDGVNMRKMLMKNINVIDMCYKFNRMLAGTGCGNSQQKKNKSFSGINKK
jgi:hypothetical protein